MTSSAKSIFNLIDLVLQLRSITYDQTNTQTCQLLHEEELYPDLNKHESELKLN